MVSVCKVIKLKENKSKTASISSLIINYGDWYCKAVFLQLKFSNEGIPFDPRTTPGYAILLTIKDRKLNCGAYLQMTAFWNLVELTVAACNKS